VSKASCISCPSGKVSAAGSGSCETCSAGTYSTDFPSDLDGYGLTAGASVCVSCPAGRVNPSKSSTQCSACAAGFSSEANATECFKCSQHSRKLIDTPFLILLQRLLNLCALLHILLSAYSSLLRTPRKYIFSFYGKGVGKFAAQLATPACLLELRSWILQSLRGYGYVLRMHRPIFLVCRLN